MLRILNFPGEAADSSRVQPLLTPANAPHYEALREGRLQLQHCEACGAVRAPGFPRCPWCGDARSQWRSHEGRGSVHSWVRYHRAFMLEFDDLVPYEVAAVALEGGPILFGRVLGGTPAIGLPAQAVIERWRDGFCALAFQVGERAMMRAAVLDAAGTADAFVLREVPVPACGEDELLVEVAACGVSFRDVVERNGTYRRDVRFPLVMGLEISGIVRARGSRVEHFEVGDHVCSKAFSSCGFCRLCRSGRESTCRERRPVRGGYAQFTALPQDAWVRVPREIPFEASCSLGPAAAVALNAVRDTARVQLTETVLVTGATGGVGLPSVQLARLAGARVIAVTRGAAKADALRHAGAHEVVTMEADGRFARQVRALTQDEGVDAVIDTVGSLVFHEAFDSLAVHGRYALVGQLTGAETSINLARLFFKRAQLLGVGSVSRAQLADVIRLTAAGRLVPQVATVLPLEAIAQAHRLVEAGQLVGRVVVTPNPQLLNEPTAP